MALVELAPEDADGTQQPMIVDTVQDDAAVVEITPDFPDVLLVARTSHCQGFYLLKLTSNLSQSMCNCPYLILQGVIWWIYNLISATRLLCLLPPIFR